MITFIYSEDHGTSDSRAREYGKETVQNIKDGLYLPGFKFLFGNIIFINELRIGIKNGDIDPKGIVVEWPEGEQTFDVDGRSCNWQATSSIWDDQLDYLLSS